MKKDNIKKRVILAGSIVLPLVSFGAEEVVAKTDSYFSNPLFNALLAIIIILIIMVMALGGALKNLISSELYITKLKEEKNNGTSTKMAGVIFLFLFLNLQSYAQETEMMLPLKDDSIGGLDQFTFYAMIVIIGAELLVIGVLFNTFKTIFGQTATKAVRSATETESRAKGKTILDKLNDTVEIENEESIMLEHDYDGIKELDNNLPPWWKYGFYLTILISVIYMINYHVTKTSPLQAEEYTRSVKTAEAEIAEYMKNSANNVDESTVKLLTDPADLSSGKDLFISNCAACHGRAGEGTVGPNLTDDYWLHKGGIKDIFKTIKYGSPDKGMKAWKDDFSPMQIAQLTSFIRSLRGTNPEKPKEKQGELYVEEASASDSTLVGKDTTLVLTTAASIQNN